MNVSRLPLGGTSVLALAFALSLTACGGFGGARSFSSIASQSSLAPPTAAAGAGEKVSGVGASSVPTTEAVVVRIENGLEGIAKPTTGNFAKALAQVRSNLPKLTDPTKASGFDQVQLLAYAACTDLASGNQPAMQSQYKINPRTNPAENRAALITAGLRILDRHTAGLASQGPTRAQVNEALDKLVSEMAGNQANTSTMAFVSVCIAATTAGSTLLGF